MPPSEEGQQADPQAQSAPTTDSTGKTWTPMEIVDGVAQRVDAPVLTVPNLERARALPELAQGEEAPLVSAGIQSFKDADRRTMNVVLHEGSLFKQQAPERVEPTVEAN